MWPVRNADADQMSTVTDSTCLVSEAQSHSSWSTIGSSSLHSGTPRLRVYVALSTGQRLIVPVPTTATIQDLQFQTLRRAAKLGVQVALGDTVVRTTGPQAAVVDGQDLVSDFVDLTADNTFALEVLNPTPAALPAITSTLSSLALQTLSSSATDAMDMDNWIFVRWITTQDAVSTTKLQRLPVDYAPWNPQATLNDLYEAAKRRFGNGQPTLSTVDPADVRLWLKECPLLANGNNYTLSYLKLVGTRSHPLDIFVQVLGDQPERTLDQITGSSEPRASWGLNTTRRGISTFITSLTVLFNEIRTDSIQLDTVLDLLLELTQFPPALTAFQRLYDGHNLFRNCDSLHLLADLFILVCNSIVPDWMCSSTESKLEGARQIFAWIQSLCVDAKALSAPKHVHKLNIFDRPSDENVDLKSIAMFDEVETIDIPNGLTSTATSLAVTLETPVAGMSRTFLLAGNFTGPSTRRWEYFFHSNEAWKDFCARPALHRPGYAEFDNLLTQANQCVAFRMVDPMRLGGCLSAELPVITLSSKGFVSTYNQEDVGCGERQFYLQNVIENRVDLQQVSPGEFISRGLEPIILERKKDGSWEVDAWAEWTEQANHGDPDESIVICVDVSGSMNSKMPGGWNSQADSVGDQTNRLMEVKEFFSQFSTRLSSYGLSTNVGLVTFSSRDIVNAVQPLTMLQLDFRDKLANARPSGQTAIYNAIDVAKDMLVNQKKASPKTKCRIILFTDGDDNHSSIEPSDCCRALYDLDIVLDAIVIGTNNTNNLFRIARSTGGYAFSPQTQHVFFQIFLLETFIDIRTRPDIQKVCPSPGPWYAFLPKEADMRDQYTFPPCRPHPNQNDYFICLDNAQKYWRKKQLRSIDHAESDNLSSTQSTLYGSTPTGSSVGGKVILTEVRKMAENTHPNISVYVSERNIGFWKVILQGPEQSPYQNGTFLLYVDIGLDFPRQPPAVRFITHILHPNISKHGRICHPIFDREWSPEIHVYDVLTHVFGMLMSLESRDAIDPIAALKFYTDPAEGHRQVAAYIRRFASRTRDQLEVDILGDDTSSIAPSDIGRDNDTSSIHSSSTIHASTPQNSSKKSSSVTGVPDAPPTKKFKSNIMGASQGTSSIYRFLASQRNPSVGQSQTTQPRARPPPLMAWAEANSLDSLLGTSTGSLPLTSSNLATVPGGGQTAAAPNDVNSVGTRVSRRASFFGMLKKAGNTK